MVASEKMCPPPLQCLYRFLGRDEIEKNLQKTTGADYGLLHFKVL
jgi:hypothetical protein